MYSYHLHSDLLGWCLSSVRLSVFRLSCLLYVSLCNYFFCQGWASEGIQSVKSEAAAAAYSHFLLPVHYILLLLLYTATERQMRKKPVNHHRPISSFSSVFSPLSNKLIPSERRRSANINEVAAAAVDTVLGFWTNITLALPKTNNYIFCVQSACFRMSEELKWNEFVFVDMSSRLEL